MTKTRRQVWLVLATLLVALPAAAQVDDCTGQADGTLCRDTDDNPCTQAACDADECEQTNPVPAGAPCCTDGTNPDPPGSPCPDTNDDPCSSPACNASGDCNQTSSRMDDGTDCPDTDGEESTRAACLDGICNQDFNEGATNPVPALSTIGGVLMMSMLMALGYWRLRRSL
jgi:hypothetical protein